MTKASDNEFPKVILKPLGLASAPADASWKLYPMADGVYARSSNSIVGPLGAGGSGAVATDVIWDAAGDLVQGTGANTAARLAIGAAGATLSVINAAVAWNSGTAFPASKLTGDRYWRTDLGLEFYWDGTRWLTTTLFTINFTPEVLMPYTVTSAPVARAATWGSTRDIYLVNWFQSWYVITTNNATNYWTYAIVEGDTGGAIASFTTAAGAASTWTQTVTAVNAVFATTRNTIQLNVTKTLTPGNTYAPAFVTYRVIAT